VIAAKPQNPVHRWRLLRRILFAAIIGFIAVMVVWIALGFLLMESYFPLAPGLGTDFAPGYTEAGFDQIEIGDSKERVLELIGAPLERCDMGRSKERFWCYSTDKRYGVFDLAWLYRAVTFDAEGRVTRLYRDIYYD
jgi:hypothetical protein